MKVARICFTATGNSGNDLLMRVTDATTGAELRPIQDEDLLPLDVLLDELEEEGFTHLEIDNNGAEDTEYNGTMLDRRGYHDIDIDYMLQGDVLRDGLYTFKQVRRWLDFLAWRQG